VLSGLLASQANAARAAYHGCGSNAASRSMLDDAVLRRASAC